MRPESLAVYRRALLLYARNPGVLIAPLIAALIGILITQQEFRLFEAHPAGADPGTALAQTGLGYALRSLWLLSSAIAVLVAAQIWESGQVDLERLLARFRRRALAIILTIIVLIIVEFPLSIGMAYITQPIAHLWPSAYPWAYRAVTIPGTFFMVYAIPAAAIGGVSWKRSLDTSVRLALAGCLATVILALAITIFQRAPFAVSEFWLSLLTDNVGFRASYPNWEWLVNGWQPRVVREMLRAIVAGYVALIVAKTYLDLAAQYPKVIPADARD